MIKELKAEDRILKIGLERAKLLSVKKGEKSSPRLKAIFLGELAELGYKVDNPELFNDSLFENFDLIIDTLRSMKGGDVSYVPLFSGFPNRVPEKHEYNTNRFLGFIGNLLGMFYEGDPGMKVLESGLVIPEWLFDLSEFGADPILGRQTEELFEHGLELQKSRKGDTHTQFVHLKLTDNIDRDVERWMKNNLYAKSSIKEALKDDIEFLIMHYGLNSVDAKKVVFKEIRAYVMAYLWNRDDYVLLDAYVSTPTDILRMFASLTDTDVSLAENIKFPKIRRQDRRFILSQLEKCSNLTDNLNAYKGMWLELGRYLHPGEYRKSFPYAFKAFDTLRNDKVTTFNGQIEKHIKGMNLNELLKLIKTKPGVFGRKLHELLDVFDDNKIIDEFKSIATDLELKNLIVLEKYFETINDSDYRTVINKKGKVIVLPNSKKGAIPRKRLDSLLKIIRDAIMQKSMESPLSIEKGTKVWIDPDLKSYMVPLSMRKQSDGLMNIARGTRIKFDNSKILRMFSYWKENSQRTDYDTSLVEFDADMNYKGHVSYTNLATSGITHSGDITSAPHGAAEFIDIDLKKLKKGVRYIALQVYIYSGERFYAAEKSYAGWMVRDKSDSSTKAFDIKTVEHKFNMVGKGSYAIPIIVDVVNSEIIYVDLYMNGQGSLNRIEGAVNDVSVVTREIVKMIDTKPNMHDLITDRITGSGAVIVDDKEDADVSYGINECTYSVDRVDEILSELL